MAAAYGQFLAEVGAFAARLEAHITTLICKLGDFRDPHKVERSRVLSQRQNYLRQHSIPEVTQGWFTKELLPLWGKEGFERKMELTLTPKQRKMIKDLWPVLEFKHERGKPTKIWLTQKGIEYREAELEIQAQLRTVDAL